MDALCELTNVSMLFEKTQALSRVDVTVRKGEIVGLLGANGAGKTTLFGIIEGLIAPSSGTVSVLGKSPDDLGALERSRVGFMFQRYALPGYIGVRELFELYASLYPDEDGPALAERLGLSRFAGKRIGHLSAGQQQRLAFFCAVYGRRSLLVLDEPTSALDVRSRLAMRELLLERKRVDNVGVLLATHEMADASQLCDRVYIIDHGEIRLEADVQTLLSGRQGRLRFEYHAPAAALEALRAGFSEDFGQPQSLARERWRVECASESGPGFLAAVLQAERDFGFTSGIELFSSQLEDVYLENISHAD